VDKRSVIGFALIGLVLIIWMTNHQRKLAEYEQRKAARNKQRAAQKESGDKATGKADDTTGTGPATITEGSDPKVDPSAPKTDVPLKDDIRLANDSLKYDLTFSNRGACILEARLNPKEHVQEADGKEGVRVLMHTEPGVYPKTVYDADGNLRTISPRLQRDLENGVATLMLRDPNKAAPLPFDTQHYEHKIDDDGSVIFTTTFANGLSLEKRFTPVDGKNTLKVAITFTNTSKATLPVRYEIVAAGRLMLEDASSAARDSLEGAVAYQKGKSISVERRPPRNTKGFLFFTRAKRLPYIRESNEEEHLAWAGTTNRYFAAILKAEESKGISADNLIHQVRMDMLPSVDSSKMFDAKAKETLSNNLILSLIPRESVLEPGVAFTHNYTLFVGPKTQAALAAVPELENLVDYGWFGVISKFLLWLLTIIHKVIPNWGVAIILLTLCMKTCLHPLQRKAQIAMRKMQHLTPLIKEMQEKYKGDRQKQSQMQMELWKKHGANPMGGCWPMLIQLPIFFGLFRMLRSTVELRHAGFCLWVTDLSQPDTLTHINGFPINILPVLMVISWVIQSHLQPKPVDPQQAQQQKMMKWMPIIFGVMLYNMASGLTLYWLTSTFLGILEQKWIKSQIGVMETEGAFAAEDAEVAQAEVAKSKKKRRTRRK
jgi:YidC/Oxa1 family membrane protein insertase